MIDVTRGLAPPEGFLTASSPPRSSRVTDSRDRTQEVGGSSPP